MTPTPMSPTVHRLRHLILHDCLDELVADYLLHHPDKRPSQVSVAHLIAWSFGQARQPSPLTEQGAHHDPLSVAQTGRQN